MCFETAQTPSPTASTGQSLAAEVKYAPQIYSENAKFSPLYTQLGLGNLSSFLDGSNGNGFLNLYANKIMPAVTGANSTANTAARTSTLKDMNSLLPLLLGAKRAMNPGAASLLDTLTSNSSRDLSYGTELTPQEKVQLNQSVRGGQAARGMGFGPSDVFNESLANTGMGQELYNQRTATAEGLVPALQSFWGNPEEIAGMGAGGTMTAGQLTGTASGGAAPSMLSQFDPQGMAMQFSDLASKTGMYNASTQNMASGTSGGSTLMSY